MSELNINLSDYKSSGVYFIEVDNSIIQASRSFTARLAVGFCETGPFNRPVYISSTADCDELFGGINRKLERKGCFTNRAIRTMVKKAPLYVLNLLPVPTGNVVKLEDGSEVPNQDKVGFNAISFDAGSSNKEGSTLFANMFDRSKFWVADENAMMSAVIKECADANADAVYGPLFGFGNCGTKDISLIVRKAEGLGGYSVTFREWYGSEDAIPYKWINPNDYVSDYFVQVIAIKGNWTSEQYKSLATDPIWSAYFTEEGLKKEKLNKFLHLDAVTVLGNWTGCIIPNFYDKQNKNKSIDYAINRVCNKTGLLFGHNATALDSLTLAYTSDPEDESKKGYNWFLDIDGDMEYDAVEAAQYKVDMVGHSLVANADQPVNFMSYNIPVEKLNQGVFSIESLVLDSQGTKFMVKAEDLESKTSEVGLEKEDFGNVIKVGDYVKTDKGLLAKVIKKQGGTIKYPKYKDVVDASTGETVVDASTGKAKKEFVLDASGNVEFEEVSGFTFTLTDMPLLTENGLSVYRVQNSPDVPDTEDENPILGESPADFQDYMVIGEGMNVDSLISADGDSFRTGYVEIHKELSSLYDTLNLLPLKGLKIGNRHMPGFDKSGNINIEEGINKIYEMLEDTAIKRGLLNNDQLDFRYVIDTMAGGMDEECGGKKYLSCLAMNKQHCTAIINIPSMSDFAKSDAPAYCDTYIAGKESKKTFNTKYIPEGGNQDMTYPGSYKSFSTITEENGSKHAGLFAPYLKYQDGSNTILVPPAADVSNTFMNKFLGGDPYKTVANLNGILINNQLVGLEYIYDQEDRDYLEPNGINPIIVRNGSTYMIYGDRTSYQNLNSDFNFLHVRELLNTIEIRCREVLDDYVFTYNIPTTRAEIFSRLDPILKAMRDSGALVKYDIQVDENNNTKEIIDNKFCIIDIGVWISQNMEKIVTRITVNRSTDA